MGLDLVLGAIILIWAIRGWFKGFLVQVIGLAALVGCFYLADPLRDALRPYAREILPAIQGPVLDRLLWWASAIASYVVTSGLALMIVRLRRRRSYGEPFEPNRGDQGAGFLLGAGKGIILTAFLAAGIVQFAPRFIKSGGAIEKQTEKSKALEWTARYQPADRIWNSPPVQSFVQHIRDRGFWIEDEEGDDADSSAYAISDPEEIPPPAAAEESEKSPPVRKPVQTAERSPSLQLPRIRPLDTESANFRDEVARAMEELGLRSGKSR